MNFFVALVLPYRFWANILREKKFENWVFFLFSFALPVILAVLSLRSQILLDSDKYGFLVSVFSIFAAFLFASQISAFTIYKGILQSLDENASNDNSDGDLVKGEIENAKTNRSKTSLRKGFLLVNGAISYLVTLSVVILVILISLTLMDICGPYYSSVLIFLIGHFFCVLFFAIGQSHEVFEAGYEEKKGS